jgi:hypothetical protein
MVWCKETLYNYLTAGQSKVCFPIQALILLSDLRPFWQFLHHIQPYSRIHSFFLSTVKQYLHRIDIYTCLYCSTWGLWFIVEAEYIFHYFWFNFLIRILYLPNIPKWQSEAIMIVLLMM